VARRRRLDELEGDDETDAGDQKDPPGRREQVAQGKQASPDFRHHVRLAGRVTM
jgi:hypothetical protein